MKNDISHETFIDVHDQDLIIRLEQNKVFRYLTNYRYVFLGNRPTDRIKDYPNVIIARDYPENIEQYKSLLDFTGQYMLVKNDLIKTDFVSFVQYDSLVLPDFERKTRNLLASHPDALIGYFRFDLASPGFIGDHFCGGIIESIKHHYGLDVRELTKKAIQEGSDRFFPGVISFACSKKTLERFVDWCAPMIDELGKQKMAGHYIERGVKFFCMANGVKNYYLPHVVDHFFASSHDQDYVSSDEKQANQTSLEQLLNGSMPILQADTWWKRFRRKVFSIDLMPGGKRYECHLLGIRFKVKKKH